MSGSNTNPFPFPGFPNVGPLGEVYLGGITVEPDGGITISGYVLISILAELRVHSVLLYGNGVPEGTSLAQLRADAVADMGPLYQANATAPIPSS